MIDEVKVYNRALDEDEVQRNFEATSRDTAVEPASKLSTTWGSIRAKY
jgi:hypothetical protein